jgi:hypothetical protein
MLACPPAARDDCREVGYFRTEVKPVHAAGSCGARYAPAGTCQASELRESYLSDVPADGEAPEQVGQSHEEEMTKLIWRITGYLGDKSIYERAVRKGALSRRR